MSNEHEPSESGRELQYEAFLAELGPQRGGGAQTAPRRDRPGVFTGVVGDLKVAARFLWRHPAFTVSALLTLGLGIGANAAIFSVAYVLVLRPLPYAESSRLVELRTGRAPAPAIDGRYVSIPAVDDIAKQSAALERVAPYVRSFVSLSGGKEPVSLTGLEVSGPFFAAYGVPPLVGRSIGPDDVASKQDLVVVLSHRVWQEYFSGDPGVIGRQISLASQPLTIVTPQAPPGKRYTVVGVMPPKDAFPVEGDVWLPLFIDDYLPRMGVSPRAIRNMAVVARVRGGLTVDRANDELRTIARRLAAEYPATDKGWGLAVMSMRNALSEKYQAAVFLLFGTVGLLLLLACVNVTSLLLTKNRARVQDVAIRKTLGGTPYRLARQFVIESLLLGTLGGAVSVAIATWCLGIVRAMAPATVPGVDALHVDWLVLGYALALSMICGLVIGLAPAIQLVRPQLGTALRSRSGPAPAWTWWGALRLRSVSVGAQVALAVPLVVGATLAAQSLDRLVRVDLGYRGDKVLTMYLKLSAGHCADFDACSVSIAEILRRVGTLPDVKAVAVAGTRPLSTPLALPFSADGDPEGRPASELVAQFQIVTPEFFRTLGIPLAAGRTFDDRDVKDGHLVAIVNDTFARTRLRNDPIGRRVTIMGREVWLDVVGRVADARDLGPARAPLPAVYIPLAQSRLIPRIALLVRTDADPSSLAAAVRAQVWAVDREAPVTDVKTMRQILADSVAEPRFQTLLLSAFAGLALVLALLGTYGVISYSVSGRLREFGVRAALGARASDIIALVVREGVAAIGMGIVVGLGFALVLSRFLRATLFEITATDPTTYGLVALLMAAVGLAAYYVPASRAARVDPMAVLRED